MTLDIQSPFLLTMLEADLWGPGITHESLGACVSDREKQALKQPCRHSLILEPRREWGGGGGWRFRNTQGHLSPPSRRPGWKEIPPLCLQVSR